MSQFNQPIRRSGGDLDVYAALVVVAFLVLAVGVGMLAMKNIEHSAIDNQEGGMFKLVQQRR